MRKQQVKRDVEKIHDLWEQAIKETPGIWKTLYKRIVEKREQIARRATHGYE